MKQATPPINSILLPIEPTTEVEQELRRIAIIKQARSRTHYASMMYQDAAPYIEIAQLDDGIPQTVYEPPLGRSNKQHNKILALNKKKRY